MKHRTDRNCTPEEDTWHKTLCSECRYALLVKLIDLIDTAAIECNTPPAHSEVHPGNTPELPWSDAQLLIERERLMHRIDALIYHQQRWHQGIRRLHGST